MSNHDVNIIPHQEVQPTSARRQGDQAEGYHGSMGSPWRHSDHSGQQSDAEGVELHHRKPRPRPHGALVMKRMRTQWT